MEDYTYKDSWPDFHRVHNRIPVPIGYTLDPEDPLLCHPDPEIIKFLEEGLDLFDGGSSYREVADWLTTHIGRSVSHQTIARMWRKKRGIDPLNPRAIQLKISAKKRRPKTKREKVQAEAKKRVAAKKASLTFAEKRLSKVSNWIEDGEEPQSKPIPVPIDVDSSYEDMEPEPQALGGKKIIFKPNEGPQEDFLSADEREVLYGGAAGGGKSYALIADPMRYFSNPNFNGILFRRTNDELRELKWKAKTLYSKAFPESEGRAGVKWSERDSTFVFPSGAQMWFTYLERDEDVLRYQGQAFNYIAFDELTQYPTPFAWDYMRSRLRSTDKSLPLYMRATTNPGGPGHGWVKKMFIDPAPYGKAFWARDLESGAILRWPDTPKNRKKNRGEFDDKGEWVGYPLFKRRFIPAKLSDNPYLDEDGEYEKNLLSLNSEQKKRQLLDGDWTVADGAAFSEFRLAHHTCEPFEIPKEWRRFRSCDFGYNSFSAVHWYALDPAYETLIVYRELYTTKKTGAELARMVLELERGERISYGVLDSSVWHQRGQTGPSIAEEMLATGCQWRPSDRTAGSRINGKNRLHELLKLQQIGTETDGSPILMPGIIFFNTCRQIIADLPVIPMDPKGGEDIDVRYSSDHAYDSIRYGIMTRPKPISVFESFGTSLSPRMGYAVANRKFGY